MNNIISKIIAFVKAAPNSVSPAAFQAQNGGDLEVITRLFNKLHGLRILAINTPTRENEPSQRQFYTRREFRPMWDMLSIEDIDTLEDNLSVYQSFQLDVLGVTAHDEDENEAVDSLSPDFQHEHEEHDENPAPRSSGSSEEWA